MNLELSRDSDLEPLMLKWRVRGYCWSKQPETRYGVAQSLILNLTKIQGKWSRQGEKKTTGLIHPFPTWPSVWALPLTGHFIYLFPHLETYNPLLSPQTGIWLAVMADFMCGTPILAGLAAEDIGSPVPRAGQGVASTGASCWSPAWPGLQAHVPTSTKACTPKKSVVPRPGRAACQVGDWRTRSEP